MTEWVPAQCLPVLCWSTPAPRQARADAPCLPGATRASERYLDCPRRHARRCPCWPTSCLLGHWSTTLCMFLTFEVIDPLRDLLRLLDLVAACTVSRQPEPMLPPSCATRIPEHSFGCPRCSNQPCSCCHSLPAVVARSGSELALARSVKLIPGQR